MGWMKKDLNGNVIDGYGMSRPVGLLRSNGVDCSEIIGSSTIHIFKRDTTERELRKIIGCQMIGYKTGVYGNINSKFNKAIYHEIEIRPNG